MFYHKCGNDLSTEITVMNFTSTLSFDIKGNGSIYAYLIELVAANLSFKSNDTLYCNACREIVINMDDIVCSCKECGRSSSLSKFGILTAVGNKGFTPVLLHKVGCREKHTKYLQKHLEEFKPRFIQKLTIEIQEA